MTTLKYNSFRSDGIFGDFTFDGDDVPFCDTLSHAYEQPDGTFLPKLPAGIYTCVRGIHKLHNGVPFETFEITGLRGHAGLLFHPLNYDAESDGCTGLGQDIVKYDSNHDGKIDELDDEMITNSRATFAAFMSRLGGVNSFQLEVKNA